jgi:hypothetical protein
VLHAKYRCATTRETGQSRELATGVPRFCGTHPDDPALPYEPEIKGVDELVDDYIESSFMPGPHVHFAQTSILRSGSDWTLAIARIRWPQPGTSALSWSTCC